MGQTHRNIAAHGAASHSQPHIVIATSTQKKTPSHLRQFNDMNTLIRTKHSRDGSYSPESSGQDSEFKRQRVTGSKNEHMQTYRQLKQDMKYSKLNLTQQGAAAKMPTDKITHREN